MSTMRGLIAELPEQLRWSAGLNPPEMELATGAGDCSGWGWRHPGRK